MDKKPDDMLTLFWEVGEEGATSIELSRAASNLLHCQARAWRVNPQTVLMDVYYLYDGKVNQTNLMQYLNMSNAGQ